MSDKRSKFVSKVLGTLTENSDEQCLKIAERSYKKAKAKIKTQLAQLEAKKVELEDQIDDAKESLTDAQFNQDFNLYTYDSCKEKLDEKIEDLEDIESTIENREELLKSWK